MQMDQVRGGRGGGWGALVEAARGRPLVAVLAGAQEDAPRWIAHALTRRWDIRTRTTRWYTCILTIASIFVHTLTNIRTHILPYEKFYPKFGTDRYRISDKIFHRDKLTSLLAYILNIAHIPLPSLERIRHGLKAVTRKYTLLFISVDFLAAWIPHTCLLAQPAFMTCILVHKK